jgi:energy-converting hydrogenase Eha subunit G
MFGLAILLPLMFIERTAPSLLILTLVFTGIVLFVPGAVYFVLVTIWHWKERYRGRHSDLWGGLILIETSGWFKLIYLFRHIIPDARGRGRYARDISVTGD